jgi:putative ABC transport system ATP-binding protein
MTTLPDLPLLAIDALTYAWRADAAPCLSIDRLEVRAGESVFVRGPSGCGKSTLLSLVAGVLTASSGRVALLGHDWASLSASRRDRLRADHVGYVFQQFNLLPYLSVLDNVTLPCRFSRRRAQRTQGGPVRDAQRLLEQVSLPAACWRRGVMELSVGQQQRVAAARALLGSPELVIADEPTSALDETLRDSFVSMLRRACDGAGSALMFVSHDARLAPRFGRRIDLPSINLAGADAASRGAPLELVA